ncbi:hypothetical protein SAMN05216480_12332 [Pustulibacterium marinum]|uniref:Uncharacterized protein n=1 Tax=Pustulibacterium marinum TaxID=1224947 RepID=A0A1I7IWG1_9FLAO|nr:hypothetical protein [Pustulibacterium marinum]SFU77239.1 hypothetical protein SAMN05216480_12332 [Pustulibacterium marinum]
MSKKNKNLKKEGIKVEFIQEEGKYVAAYPFNYQGFEFIYVKNKNHKTLLFENRLAIEGVWLNDKQIAEMVQPIIDAQYYWKISSETQFITEGDEILIESYKHRGIGVYDKNGFLSKQTPDCIRSLKVKQLNHE